MRIHTTSAYVNNLLFALVPALLLWMVLGISMSHDRSRYRNCYFLIAATLFTLPVLFALFGDYAALPMIALALAFLLTVLAVPAMLIANGVHMIRKEGKSLQNLLSLFVGIGVGIGEICAISFAAVIVADVLLPELRLPDLGITVLRAQLGISFTVIYFSLSFVTFMFYTLFLEIVPRKRDFDYVIIHGAGLRKDGSVTKLLAERLDKAIAVYHKDPTPPILIPSGGQGADEAVSEAEAMAKYLRAHGIPEEKILLEDKSTTTFENLRNSKALIEADGRGSYVALVTSNYHVYRALRYCRRIGLKCTGIGAHVARYYWPSALIREYIAIHREPKHLILLLAGWIVTVWLPLFVLLFAH